MQPTARSTLPLVQRDRHRAGRVAQVPEHQRPGVVGDPGQRRRVREPRRAVGDVRAARRARSLGPTAAASSSGVTPAARSTSIQRSVSPHSSAIAGGDVAVGREVVAVDHDLGAARPRGDRRAHQLVEQHGRGVADRGLARRGAQHDPAEVVADRPRQVEPALVPAADQPPAPLLLDEPREPRRRSPSAAGPASCRRSRRAADEAPTKRSRYGASGSAVTALLLAYDARGARRRAERLPARRAPRSRGARLACGERPRVGQRRQQGSSAARRRPAARPRAG